MESEVCFITSFWLLCSKINDDEEISQIAALKTCQFTRIVTASSDALFKHKMAKIKCGMTHQLSKS
jgi:hypothetical protein